MAEAAVADAHRGADGWRAVAGCRSGHHDAVSAGEFDVDDRIGVLGADEAGFPAVHERRRMDDPDRFHRYPVSLLAAAAVTDLLIKLQWQVAFGAARQHEFATRCGLVQRTDHLV